MVCCRGTALWTSTLSSMNRDLPACLFSGFRAHNVHVKSNSYDCCLVIKANARERARPPDTSRVMLGHPRAQGRFPSPVGVRAGRARQRLAGAVGMSEAGLPGGQGRARLQRSGCWMDSLQLQGLCGQAGLG